MVINCFDIFDFVLLWFGCIDCKIEFFLLSVEVCVDIFCIYSCKMNLICGINFMKIVEKMNGCFGVEFKGVCIELGMYVLCERRVYVI